MDIKVSLTLPLEEKNVNESKQTKRTVFVNVYFYRMHKCVLKREKGLTPGKKRAMIGT